MFPFLFLINLVSAQLTPSQTYNPPDPTAGLTGSTSTPNAQWANVLGNSLWFYDAQRSGKLDQGTYGNRVSWRNDSALKDGSDWGIDLTAGWYDAGDYIKATFPLGFTMFTLGWAALTHGRGYSLTGQTAYLDGTLRWGYDWLMKAHPADDVLFVQVGSSDIDNDYWGGDQNIPTPRPAYPVNNSYPGTDVWASTSAAFAIGSLLYSNSTYSPFTTAQQPSNPSLTNTTYSDLLLNHARTLYSTANSTKYQSFATSIPAVAGAYGSSGWGDDMALAALSLAITTNSSQYYLDAFNWYKSSQLSGKTYVYNWDSKSPAVYVVFVEAAKARPGLAESAGLNGNLTGWQSEAERYFDQVINGTAQNTYLTKAGLLIFRGDSDFASLNPSLSFSLLLLKYSLMASSIDKSNRYYSFAQSQIDYLMGNNPMNAVYMVGSHPNSPKSPHSAPASGGTSFTNLRTDPPENKHILYGAVVGGPLANDMYWDRRDDWVQNEVALDYNAAVPGIASMQIINGTSDPYYVRLSANTYSIPNGQPCDAALPCNASLSAGTIAGIVLGMLAFLALVIGLVWWNYRRDNWGYGSSSIWASGSGLTTTRNTKPGSALGKGSGSVKGGGVPDGIGKGTGNDGSVLSTSSAGRRKVHFGREGEGVVESTHKVV